MVISSMSIPHPHSPAPKDHQQDVDLYLAEGHTWPRNALHPRGAEIWEVLNPVKRSAPPCCQKVWGGPGGAPTHPERESSGVFGERDKVAQEQEMSSGQLLAGAGQFRMKAAIKATGSGLFFFSNGRI